MKKILIMFSLIVFSNSLYADLSNCTDIYVGSMTVDKTGGLVRVVFLGHPDNSSGSNVVFINGWDPDAKKEAMSLMTAAKIAKHKIYIETEAADKCSITSPGQELKLVALRNKN